MFNKFCRKSCHFERTVNKADNVRIDVILRRVCVTQFCSKKISQFYIFWVCILSLISPACNVHAPYYHLWPPRLYQIFCTLPHTRYNIRWVWSGWRGWGNILNTKFVFIFSTTFSETFLILSRVRKDIIMNVHTTCKARFICVMF